MRFRSVFKKLGLFAFLITVLAGAAHLYLYYRAGALLKSFVEEVSDGDYTVNSKKLRLSYFPLKIRATGIYLYPLKKEMLARRYEIKADSVELSLRALSPLLFYNVLEVKNVRIVRPFITVESDGENVSKSEAQFNIPLQEIQEGLLKGLAQFQVDKCEIIDGGFRVKRTDVAKVLSVNSMDITIDSLLAAKEGMLLSGHDTLMGHLTLRLNKPDIEIPDSNYLVYVDKLYVNTRENIFSIEELRFSINKKGDAYDTLQLSSIELRGLNWPLFLKRGIVELDSVRVKNGIAQFDLSDRMLFERNKEQSEQQISSVEVPLILHNVTVNEVDYKLRSKRKEGLFTMTLQGDSLQVQGFKLVDTLSPKLSIASLSLNVRNYSDGDDKKTYRGGFDRMLINTNNLELRNYELIPLKNSTFGANNRLFIPTLQLQQYDLEQLLTGRLVANKVLLNQPALVIDIARRKKGNKGEGASAFFDFLKNKVKPVININLLEIREASLTLQPRNKTTSSIRISNLSTQIDIQKLLSAKSVKDLMQVSDGISSDGFFISGSNFDFRVTEGVISSNAEEFKMKRLQGTIASNFEIDLDDVNIVSRQSQLPFPVDGLMDLERVEIGSGAIQVRASERKPTARKPVLPPELWIDNLDARNLQVLFINAQGAASQAEKLQLKTQNLFIKNKEISWLEAFLTGSSLNSGTDKMSFKIGRWTAQMPGKVSIYDAQVWPSVLGAPGVTATLPAVHFSTPLQIIEWNPDLISNLVLENPTIRWKAKDSGEQKGSSPILPDFFLNRLTVFNPDVYGLLSLEKQKHAIEWKGGKILLENLKLKPDSLQPFQLDRVDIQIPKSVIQIDSSWTLKPASIRFLGSQLGWSSQKGATGTIDSLVVQGIGGIPLLKKDSTSISMEYAGISNWHFPFSFRDSIAMRLSQGPNWWLGGGDLSAITPHYNIKIHNFSAARQGLNFRFDSLTMKPPIGIEEFYKTNNFEKDYVQVKLGPTLMEDVKPATAAFEGAFIRKVTTNGFDITAQRNKALPDDTVSYKPLLADQLRKIAFPFEIDTFSLKNGNIRYEEAGQKFDGVAIVFFDQVEGDIYNLSSQQKPLQDSLKTNLSARFMGASPMYLRYHQSYFDSMQGFWMRAGTGEWSLAAINPLVRPLASLEFLRGAADSMYLDVIANKKFAFGYMGFDYESMRLALLKKGTERKFLLAAPANFFINLILRSNSDGTPRPLFVERMQNKGTFNYWAKILNAGMQHNLRIPGKGKKARQYERKEKAADRKAAAKIRN